MRLIRCRITINRCNRWNFDERFLTGNLKGSPRYVSFMYFWPTWAAKEKLRSLLRRSHSSPVGFFCWWQQCSGEAGWGGRGEARRYSLQSGRKARPPVWDGSAAGCLQVLVMRGVVPPLSPALSSPNGPGQRDCQTDGRVSQCPPQRDTKGPVA